jgi:hypothetical protein
MRTSRSTPLPIVAGEFIFWCSASVIAYSLVVPVVALDSLFLAESLLQFTTLHQAAMLVLIMLVTVNTFGQLIVKGWQSHHWLSLCATFTLLLSVKPSEVCCTKLVAAISGMLPFSEVKLTDVILHLLPIIGGCLLLIEAWWIRRPVTTKATRQHS